MSESPSVASGSQYVFGAFQMDVGRYRLWRGGREIPLRPKCWDVLHYLVKRPGLLVTKEAFHREIWADTAVSDDALTKSIIELRRVLGDSRRTPRFIETVHGRGYRFVAEVRDAREPAPDRTADMPAPPATVPARGGETRSRFVGRHIELKRLHECLRKAQEGERQVAFITGEAGIGKTTLAEEFLRSPASGGPDVYVLHGQCIQQHGQREPYMPVLEALERAIGSPAGSTLIPLLRRVAPCWCAQIPWLWSEGEPKGFQGMMMAAPPERMLREITVFLESVATRSTVVLVLEDLHWSDNATADLLLYLAQRHDPARLLIIGTFRLAEASTLDHPIRDVRRTLRAHHRCADLPLDYLSTADVREYLQGRFGEYLPDLAPLIHQRTDGNPLFVVAIVEELIRRGQLAPTDGGWVMEVIPDRLELAISEDLLEMVTAQFQSMGADEQSLLETASVVGASFDPATVARALGRDAEEVDAVLQRMAGGHLFLNLSGAAGDRGSAGRYDFAHALHHQVIYEQIPLLRRRRLHLSVAEVLESSSGERLAEIAPELSVHFEQAGDYWRAAKYLGMCVARAQQRQAPHEAIACAEIALDLLERLPDSPQRRQSELEIRLLLGVSLYLTRGFGSEAVKDNYERARALCAGEGNARQLFEVLHAVLHSQMVNSQLEAARASIEELARIAEGQPSPEFRLRVELTRGRTEFWSGHFGTAARIFAQFLDAVTGQPIEKRPQTYGIAPAIAAYAHGSLALWFLGQPDQARAWSQKAVAGAEESREPFAIASALTHASFLELLCGNAEGAAHLAARAAKVSAGHAVANFVPISRFFGGAAMAAQGDLEGGLAAMLPALVEHRDVVGSIMTDVMLGLVGAAYARAGRWDEGLARVEEGLKLSAAVREHVYAAELWRIKGELLLGRGRASKRRRRAAADSLADTAQQCFHRALEIARGQEAKALELRTLMSLMGLPMRREESQRAREVLRSLLPSFTEGFDTKDIQDATALLNLPGQVGSDAPTRLRAPVATQSSAARSRRKRSPS